MSEINNLPQYSGKIDQKINIQPKVVEEPAHKEEDPVVNTNASNVLPDLGVVGKSQVKQADSISNDLNFLTKNPELVEIADKYFDKTLEKLEKEGDPHAYEHACLLSAAFAKELSI